MNRLFAIAGPVGLLLVVVGVVLLVAPDASFAGPLKDIGDNTQTEVGGLIGKLFLVALGITFVGLWFARQYPAMVVSGIAACLVAYMVLAPSGASSQLKAIAQSIFGG